jgi:hypothetical protein
VNGKTVNESFATPGERRKAERELEAFRRYRQLERSFIEVNERICRVRPVKDALTAEKKGRGDPGRGRDGFSPPWARWNCRVPTTWALIREALKSLIAREAGRRLLALAGTAPNIEDGGRTVILADASVWIALFLPAPTKRG